MGIRMVGTWLSLRTGGSKAGGRALWFDPTIAAAIAPGCPG
jgi:hypothetical protein